MNGRKTATKGRSGKRVASRRAKIAAAAPAPQPTHSPPAETLRQRKYQELIRKHLNKLLDQLFAEFTGLHFHITWAPSPPHEWETRDLPTACSVCCRLSGSPLLKNCRICGPRQLVRALRGDGDGQHFTCRLGVRNYWFPIRVRGETLGIAYLQALDHATTRRPTRNRSARAAPPRRHRSDAVVMSRLEFVRAARLLQLIVQHVQTSSLSDLRKADLSSAGRAVLALEKEQVRLHEAIQRHLPPEPKTLRPSGPESHAEQIVHHLLERIELDFAKQITLQHYAHELGMNAAYLSDLFSHALGVSFKTCLTGARMAKAKSLLGDPAKTASDVAYAVGYASENRFRAAFKKATGLSPKLWRETMKLSPPL
jgi:AraC-like DNA-binding protein